MDEEMKEVDPVSGNEIPPGATASEVRDDVPIMASENEYVLPADVVRYIGLDRIEKMVKQAKKGLMELDAEGRIGGEKATMDEDLPFSPEELMAVDDVMQAAPVPAMMAEGGLVTNFDMDIDPATGLPKWLLAMQQGQATPVADTSSTGSIVLSEPRAFSYSPEPQEPSTSESYSNLSQAEKDARKMTGLAKPVGQWSVDDYNKYANFRTSPEASVFKAATAMVPLGGIISAVGQRATERSVNQNLTEMIKSGKDLNGKPLSTDQLNTLRETYSRVTGEPISRLGGLSGAAVGLARNAGLINRKGPTEKQVERYNERVQGDSLINRAIDFVTGSGRKTTPSAQTGTTSSATASAPVTRTTSSGVSKGTTTSSGAPRESAADKELGKNPSAAGTGAKKGTVGANNSTTKTSSTTSKKK
jgi:hypothetical protein